MRRILIALLAIPPLLADIRPAEFFRTPILPYDSVATSDDSTALHYNPAGLGYHPLQGGYFFSRVPSSGLSDHTGFLNLFGLGLSGVWRNDENGGYARKYTVGTGLGGNRIFSLGTSYSAFEASDALLDRRSRWDIGAMLRPSRYMSLGAVARGVNRPDSYLSETWWDFGVALRPFPYATERLTFAVDTSYLPSRGADRMFPRFNIEYKLSSGFTIYGGWGNIDSPEGGRFGLQYSAAMSSLYFQGGSLADRSDAYTTGIMFGSELFTGTAPGVEKVLVLELDAEYSETKRPGNLFISEKPSFYDLLNAISFAKSDPGIRAIILKGSSFKGGWGQAEELRALIREVREVKPVYAWLESASNKEYYIASAATNISMPPAGSLEVSGLSASVYHIRDLLNKIGIKADMVRIGDYKSAPETFTENSISAANREQLTALLQSYLNRMKNSILADRKGISPAEWDEILKKGFFQANAANQRELIDSVRYYHELEEQLKTPYDRIIPPYVSLKGYLRIRRYDDSWGPRPIVAIVPLEGDIVSGETATGIFSDSAIGSDTYSRLLRKLAENPQIKSVIIRINSPGGSALASDILWKEIRNLKDEGKVVIISVADVAASGGYYLAMGGDSLVANGNSILGSIGVFGGKISAKGLYGILGVNKTVIKTHPRAALFTEHEDFTPEERALIQEQMTEFYDLFLSRVMENRKADRSVIEKQAGGRIYSGDDALKNSMSDRTGGLLLAISIARNQARIPADYSDVIVYSPRSGFALPFGDASRMALPAIVESALSTMNRQERLRDEKVLFMMPLEADIR